MRKAILMILVIGLMVLTGCKDTDNASKWVGTYTTAAGGLTTNTFNQVVVQENSTNTVRMLLDTLLPNQQVYTYAALQNIVLQSATTGSFYETDSVLGFTHPLLLNGTATLIGNTLTVIGKGTNATDTINFYFYGTKN